MLNENAFSYLLSATCCFIVQTISINFVILLTTKYGLNVKLAKDIKGYQKTYSEKIFSQKYRNSIFSMFRKTWHKEWWRKRNSTENVWQKVRNLPTNLKKDEQLVKTTRKPCFLDQTNETRDAPKNAKTRKNLETWYIGFNLILTSKGIFKD